MKKKYWPFTILRNATQLNVLTGKKGELKAVFKVAKFICQ